jgi:hypothetical protein
MHGFAHAPTGSTQSILGSSSPVVTDGVRFAGDRQVQRAVQANLNDRSRQADHA